MRIRHSLMTVRECCQDGRISRATFYRLVKSDPRFPVLLKIGSSTRVRTDSWQQYIGSEDEADDDAEAA